MEKLLRFVTSSDKPWMLLLPQYVARKGYFLSWLNSRSQQDNTATPLFFIGPKTKPYEFTARRTQQQDEDEGEKVGGEADVAVRAGKFQCVWFVSLGIEREALVSEWEGRVARGEEADVVLCERVEDLPQLTLIKRPSPAERRWRKKQRLLQVSVDKEKESVSEEPKQRRTGERSKQQEGRDRGSRGRT